LVRLRLGKEADNMLRRLVFALMLIAAAFVGGATINGPGLAWLKRNFAGGPSIIVDGSSARPPEAKTPPKQFPTAKTPPLEVNLPRNRPAPGALKKANPGVDLARSDPPLLPESPSTPASALAPLPGPAPSEADPTPPAFASNPVAPEPANLPPLDPGPSPKSDPVARLASVETPASSSSKDWSELRGRMKALGIVRYSIEGETDGRVRFSCVIPVDGLKAVGHHFEAEGDDEPKAVEAALKRITLWKATSPE
jgi:hypothetical protein